MPDDPRVWGPTVSDADVADAVERSLRHWLPGALAEAGRRRGYTPAQLGYVQSWDRLATGDDLNRDGQPPAVLVTTTDTEYERAAQGVHDAVVSLTITAAVPGDTTRDTHDRCATWVLAVELALLQDPTLRGGGEPVSAALQLDGHAIRPLSPDTTRTVLLGSVDVQVLVQGALQAKRGPVVPGPSPFPEPDPEQPDVQFPDPGEYPHLNTLDVTVTQQEEAP